MCQPAGALQERVTIAHAPQEPMTLPGAAELLAVLGVGRTLLPASPDTRRFSLKVRICSEKRCDEGSSWLLASAALAESCGPQRRPTRPSLPGRSPVSREHGTFLYSTVKDRLCLRKLWPQPDLPSQNV